MVRFSQPFRTRFQYHFIVLSHTDIYHRFCATSNAGSMPPPRFGLQVLILDHHPYLVLPNRWPIPVSCNFQTHMYT